MFKMNLLLVTFLPFVCASVIPLNRTSSCPERDLQPVCDDGWTYLRKAGKCYKVLHDKNFPGAWKECPLEGGDLASFHSEAENTLVAEFASFHIEMDVIAYIGLYDPEQRCNYRWTDGTAYDYNHWYGGYPNSCAGQANSCVVMILDVNMSRPNGWIDGYKGLWWSRICTDPQKAICEKEPRFL